MTDIVARMRVIEDNKHELPAWVTDAVGEAADIIVELRRELRERAVCHEADLMLLGLNAVDYDAVIARLLKLTESDT